MVQFVNIVASRASHIDAEEKYKGKIKSIFSVLMSYIEETNTQSRIIGAVRGSHYQLYGTIFPVFSPYAPRKYKRFGTPAIVRFTGRNLIYMSNV